MADKQISQLVAASTINNDDLFVMQQGGTAKKLSGQKLSDFVYQSAADQIERVNEAVEQTQAAVDALEEQKNEIAQTIASMAELGTDTTLTTPGMAADAAATGEVKDIALARFEQAEITGVPIATFDDGADNVPVKKLVVNIEPVQDLHGYDNPWPAGGGKNLFNNTSTTKTVNDVTFTVNSDGSVNISGTASANISTAAAFGTIKLAPGTYYVSGSYTGTNNQRLAVNDGGSIAVSVYSGQREFTVETETTANVYPVILAGEVVNTTFYPMVRLASQTDPTYVPYENICPITGWTGAKVTRDGKNLFHYDAENIETILNDQGQTRGCYRLGLSGCTLSFSASAIDSSSVTASNINIGRLKNGIGYVLNTFIASTSITSRTYTFADDEEAIFLSNSISVISNNIEKYNVQVELASEPTAFEPFNGDVYTVTFPNEAGTVYGGTLDVTNGVLTVDRAMLTLDGSEASRWQEYSSRDGYRYAHVDTSVIFTASDCVSNRFIVKSTNTGLCIRAMGGYYLWFCQVNDLNGVSDLTSWLTWLSNNPVQFSYKITPIVYQLTPTEVKTLLGLNNILADTGNINDLIYRKMPIPTEELENTIESMLAGVEQTMEATTNYTTDRLVVAAHKLYHITANIASGETLVPGTNCYVTTIADELSDAIGSINSQLGSLGNLSNLTYQVVT